MNISDLFKTLSFGELSGLSMSDEGTGSITEEKQPSIVYYAGQALTSIYSRFAHKIDYVILEQSEGITRYVLDAKHAASDTSGANTNVRYLLDTAEEPFEGDVLRILSVRGFDDQNVLEDHDLLLNDNPGVPSMRTLSYKSVKFESVTPGKKLLIQVQQNHPTLTIPADLDQEILLAPILQEALAYKVAARVFKSMNGETNIIKGSQLDQQYESVLATITKEDLLQVNFVGNANAFKLNGFV